MMQVGDHVRNVNPQSRYYSLINGKVGVVKRLLPYFFFAEGYDVEYEGVTGPYGYPYLAQSVLDLEEIVGDATKQEPETGK